MKHFILAILAIFMLTMSTVNLMAAEKVAVLTSGPHGNEYQNVDKKLSITLDSYGETPQEVQRLIDNLDAYRLILTTPLYKVNESELAKQGARLRRFLENGGGIIVNDANGQDIMDLMGAIDPQLAVQTGKCDWDDWNLTTCEPLPEIARVPNELHPGAFWGHMIVPDHSRWTVLFRCSHGHARMVFAPVGKGGILMTSTRYERLQTVENMLRFLTRDQAQPFKRLEAEKPLLQVESSRSRGMISTCRRFSEVTFPITIHPDGKHDLQDSRVLLEMRNAQGQVVAQSTDRTGKTALDLKLPIGTYTVHVTLFSKNGERLAEAQTAAKILAPEPGQMLIDEDGTLLKEGKPFFPLGIYHIQPKDYDRAAELGFNLFHVWSWDGMDALDTLEQKGITVLWEQNHRSPKVIAENAPQLRSHRALGLLYTTDEPSEEMFDDMLNINSSWHEHIPNRLTYVVSYVLTHFAQNAEMGDILAVDSYPWPDRPVTNVANVTDAARQALNDRKTLIVVPQSFGKEPEDVWRCMAFLALTHGAKGIIWYPWNQIGGGPVGLGMHDKPELQKAAKRLISELKTLTPALTSTAEPRRFVEADGKLHGMVCFDLDNKRTYLLLANSANEPLSYTLEIPELPESTAALKEAFSDHTIPVTQRKISLELKPYDTKILVLPVL